MKPLVLVLALGLVAALASTAQVDGETTCEQEARELRAEYLSQRFEGPETREDLLLNVRQFQERHREAPTCALQSRDYEVVLLLLNNRLAPADSVLDATLEDPHFERLPAGIQSRLFYNKGYVIERFGRLGDAALFYYRGAALGDRMPAHEGIKAYIGAAAIARDLNDPVARVYLDAAARILRDSTLAPDEERTDRASISIQRAQLANRDGLAAATTKARRHAHEAARRHADRAYTTLQDATEDSDIGRAALALIYRARAEMHLGRFGEADRSIRAASPLLPAGRSVFQTLENSWWSLRTQIDLRAGRLEPALAWSLRAEEKAAERTTIAAWYAETRARTGTIYERLGRLDEAERAYREAIALTSVERDRIGLRDWTASSFEALQHPHRALAGLLVRTGRPWEALEALDATRALTFRDLRARTVALRRLPPDAREATEALVDSLESVRLALATTEDVARKSALVSSIASLQDSIQVYLNVERVQPAELDRSRIQAALAQDGRVILSYLLTEEATMAFVVRSDTFAVVPLPAHLDSIRAQGDRFTSGWTQASPDAAFDRTLAQTLHANLVQPIAHLLPDGAPITLISDPALAQIPFPALVEPGEGDSGFLVHRHPITTELAVGLMGRTDRDESPARLDVLALGRSRFDSVPGTAALPNVPAELRQVRSHAAQTQTALDEAATEAMFSSRAPDARIIHLASHAYVDPEIPFNSRILLSDAPDAEDDGTLYLHELQNRPLVADLVVLSGCSTARGRQHAGEGMIGLQYGVRVAGAGAALATLWPVDDEATVVLMDAFYGALARGARKDEALQAAQIAYLDAADAGRASPFFWAGAILSGDPAPVPFRTRSPWAMWLGLAALGGAAGLAWRLRSQIRPPQTRPHD